MVTTLLVDIETMRMEEELLAYAIGIRRERVVVQTLRRWSTQELMPGFNCLKNSWKTPTANASSQALVYVLFCFPLLSIIWLLLYRKNTNIWTNSTAYHTDMFSHLQTIHILCYLYVLWMKGLNKNKYNFRLAGIFSLIGPAHSVSFRKLKKKIEEVKWCSPCNRERHM